MFPDRLLEALKREAIEMPGPRSENVRQRLMWEKVSLSEMEILNQEWARFVRENDATRIRA